MPGLAAKLNLLGLLCGVVFALLAWKFYAEKNDLLGRISEVNGELRAAQLRLEQSKAFQAAVDKSVTTVYEQEKALTALGDRLNRVREGHKRNDQTYHDYLSFPLRGESLRLFEQARQGVQPLGTAANP